MIIPCRSIEQLLQRAMSYPRRVKLIEEKTAMVFKADNGARIYIAKVDFKKSAKGDNLPYRTKFFLNAIKTEKGRRDYCESLNYGKPDWKP